MFVFVYFFFILSSSREKKRLGPSLIAFHEIERPLKIQCIRQQSPSRHSSLKQLPPRSLSPHPLTLSSAGKQILLEAHNARLARQQSHHPFSSITSSSHLSQQNMSLLSSPIVPWGAEPLQQRNSWMSTHSPHYLSFLSSSSPFVPLYKTSS